MGYMAHNNLTKPQRMLSKFNSFCENKKPGLESAGAARRFFYRKSLFAADLLNDERQAIRNTINTEKHGLLERFAEIKSGIAKATMMADSFVAAYDGMDDNGKQKHFALLSTELTGVRGMFEHDEGVGKDGQNYLAQNFTPYSGMAELIAKGDKIDGFNPVRRFLLAHAIFPKMYFASRIARADAEATSLEINASHEVLHNALHDMRRGLDRCGHMELIAEDFYLYDNAKKRELLTLMRDGLSNMNAILDRCEDWIKTGKLYLQNKEFEASHLASEIQYKFKSLAESKGVKIVSEVPGGICIYGDIHLAKRTLDNLVANAIKFTPEGGSVTVGAKQNGMVEIFVKDTGTGIPKENIPKILAGGFTTVGARGEEGTGQGVGIARKFVEAHGGELRIESEPGMGSTFTFTLPSAKQPVGPTSPI